MASPVKALGTIGFLRGIAAARDDRQSTGGQVHDSQVVGDVLDTPKPPLAVTADKAYDSEKVRQQIKDEGELTLGPHGAAGVHHNKNSCTAAKPSLLDHLVRARN